VRVSILLVVDCNYIRFDGLAINYYRWQLTDVGTVGSNKLLLVNNQSAEVFIFCIHVCSHINHSLLLEIQPPPQSLFSVCKGICLNHFHLFFVGRQLHFFLSVWDLSAGNFSFEENTDHCFFVVFLFFGQLMKLMNYIFYHLQSKVPCCNRAIKSNNRDINNSRWCKFFIPFSLFQKKTDSIQFVMMTNNDGIPTLFLFFPFSHFHKTPTAWAVDDRRWSWTAHHQSLSKSFEMPVSLRGAMPFLKAKWPAIPGPNYPGPVKASHFLQVKKKRRTNPSSTSFSLFPI